MSVIPILEDKVNARRKPAFAGERDEAEQTRNASETVFAVPEEPGWRVRFVLALRSRGALAAMRYGFKAGRALAVREQIVTFSLIFAEGPRLFHARNPFPIGGVYEDPATDAAAAVLADVSARPGLAARRSRDLQGEDMAARSRL